MVRQYPHYLFVKNVQEAVAMANGSYKEQGDDEWQLFSSCRYEGGRAAVLRNDGTVMTFSATVYMPKGERRITEGTEVLVSTESVPSIVMDEEAVEILRSKGSVKISGECQGFENNQMNRRMYV